MLFSVELYMIKAKSLIFPNPLTIENTDLIVISCHSDNNRDDSVWDVTALQLAKDVVS